MDLTVFEKASDEGADMVLKDPAGKGPIKNGDGSEVTIKLAGITSPRWTRAMDALQNRLIANKDKTLSAEDIRGNRCGLLAAATLDWNGIEVDGNPVPFSEANAKKLYLRFRWVADQADEFIAAKEHFLPASSKDF
jgi:hypothetical protein